MTADKYKGFIKIVSNERYYTTMQIDLNPDGKTFSFVEKKGRFSPLKIPAFVTQEMLELVKAEVYNDPLFSKP